MYRVPRIQDTGFESVCKERYYLESENFVFWGSYSATESTKVLKENADSIKRSAPARSVTAPGPLHGCFSKFTGSPPYPWRNPMFGFKFQLVVVSFMLCALNACVHSETDVSGPLDQPTWFVEGTPQTIGILNFLNRTTTTFEVLRDEVPLSAYAANAISDLRNGPDGVLSTEDDVVFETLTDVMKLPAVMEADIVQLYAYTEHNGLVPQGDDPLGDWDGQSFSVSDAERVVWVANTTDEDMLDGDAALDQRAVTAIVEARPLRSVAELAELHFVGPSTMERLVAYAQELYPNWGRTGECTPFFTAAPWAIVGQANQLFQYIPEAETRRVLFRDAMDGCSDFVGNRDWENKVSRILWSRWMTDGGADETLSVTNHHVRPWMSGGMVFIEELNRVALELDEVVASSAILPVFEVNAQVLFQDRTIVFDELLEDVYARPLDFVEQVFDREDGDCIQRTVILLDLSHETLLVFQRDTSCRN